jgi:hypothetical protein
MPRLPTTTTSLKWKPLAAEEEEASPLRLETVPEEEVWEGL